MNTIKAYSYLFLLICFLTFTQAQISQEYIKQSEVFVRNSIENGLLNFENLYKEGFNYKALADLNVIQSANACSFLQKQGDIQKLLTDSKSIYYFLKLKQMIPKCNIEYSTAAIKEVLQNESSSVDTPEQVYYTTALAFELNMEKIYSQTCGLYMIYLQQDGTSRVRSQDQENRNNIATGYILDTLQLCLLQQQQGNQNQIKKSFNETEVLKFIDIPLESILVNSVQVENRQICILESTLTLEVTAKIYKFFTTVTAIQNLQSYKTFQSKFKNGILSFLKENANSQILNPSEKFELVNIYLNAKDSDVVTVKKALYDLKTKQSSILVHYENILGEKTQKTQPLKAALYRREKLVQADILSTNSTNEQWPLEFKINNSLITEPGFHYLKIYNNQEEILSEKVLFTTTLTVKNIEFEVAQGKGKIPKKYTHSYNLKTKKVEKVQANQNSFVYVQFAFSFANEKYQFSPSQVAIRLRHPTFKGVTHLVNAEYDEISNSYLAIVDFGDPLIILPYSATYEAELIIADQRLTQQIVHNFVTLETTFKTNRNDKNPPNDADYILPKPISYVINDEIKTPPILFIYAVVFMMACCFIFFFVMLNKIDLNWDKYNNLSGLQKIYVQIFILSILIAFSLLLLFWVQINLMETVTYICAGIIPFLIIGNLALNSLTGSKKQN
ncbi:oligosaccharyltransferase subunit ribophorin II (macronuclear) [Tetrahymena thermophila SB210]|uniref:Dolichyl-diphosphooligosaccharide--protein glycosyltransferase subunit 2 n=1 Tax=Tetrahymena thermophila (strain SB210) TaxID=312017 RepID=Q22ZG2_TETTS|nr:oligosaccharyltransferase subunit ribophorin II [Tetrahymena thermophila SB210]EAR90685.2 oligosaccharyltransferase subunit ribophorin II [Tetrahymena thermophila SB210]|eukprot:XP_001010930.2 oligosaccharyltransferase subunit ribophorin II [Tetrahymena thermophila SB210]